MLGGRDPYPTLDQLLEALRQQFVTIEPRDLARIRLDELTFNGSFESYLDYFRRLKTTLGNTITKEDLASKLIKPLPNEVKLQISLAHIDKNPPLIEEMLLVYAKEQKKGSMLTPSKKRGRDYPNEGTPVQKFKKALLSNVESDPELNKWIVQNKGCLKCRRLNTNHFAREFY